MSRKYHFNNKSGLYFVSFSTINWIDIFVRDVYFNEMLNSLEYCRANKGMEIYSWCIMTSHIHMIFKALNDNPGDVMRDLKTFTSKTIQKLIQENPQESRKEWILEMMQKQGERNSNVKYSQLWQQHNMPIELWSAEVIDQKVEYIHNNPVEAGFVTEPWHWKYSSAVDYAGQKGLLKISFV